MFQIPNHAMLALTNQPYESLILIFHSQSPILTLILRTPFQDNINLSSNTKAITPPL